MSYLASLMRSAQNVISHNCSSSVTPCTKISRITRACFSQPWIICPHIFTYATDVFHPRQLWEATQKMLLLPLWVSICLHNCSFWVCWIRKFLVERPSDKFPISDLHVSLPTRKCGLLIHVFNALTLTTMSFVASFVGPYQVKGHGFPKVRHCLSTEIPRLQESFEDFTKCTTFVLELKAGLLGRFSNTIIRLTRRIRTCSRRV